MEWFEALLLGLIQGLTEFLPVSSSGHLEIGKELLGVETTDDLLFTTMVHAAEEYLMFVWQVAELKGITFDMVNERFMVDYTTEDAERFWNSKWSDVQNTWLFYTPIYKLFWG